MIIDKIRKIPYCISLIAVLLFCSSCENTFSQNVALNKKYYISVEPDYEYTKDLNDNVDLTDGIAGQRNMWIQRKSVGWRATNNIEISIDLKKLYVIDNIKLYTMKNHSVGVYQPRKVYFFLSKDNRSFNHVATINNPIENDDQESFRNILISADFGPTNGRFVKLIVVPDRHFFFCDEVEVLRTNLSPSIENLKYPISKPDEFIEEEKKLDIGKNGLYEILQYESQGESKRKEDKLTTISKIKTLSDLLSFRTQILRNRSKILKKEFKRNILWESIDPWDSIHRYTIPLTLTDKINSEYELAEGHTIYMAFKVHNLSKTVLPVQIIRGINKNLKISIFSIDDAYNGIDKFIPDVLTEIHECFSIDKHEVKLLLIKVVTLQKGNTHLKIEFQQKYGGLTIDSPISVFEKDSSIPQLNANIWAYFNYPLLKNNVAEAAHDLADHHINTYVIHTSQIPNIGETDFSKTLSYINNIERADNLIFYLAWNWPDRLNGKTNGGFLSKQWKTAYMDWYNRLVETVKRSKFPKAEVYLYPYDEISKESDMDNFDNIILWNKTLKKPIKFFATLSRPNEINRFRDKVDLSQIYITPENELIANHIMGEVWFYEGLEGGRSRSPLYDYRAMAWRAYKNGYTGIGFWNYADEHNDIIRNYPDLIQINKSTDFSVIYHSYEGKLLSSLRWEGFSKGIEDFYYLKLHDKKYGAHETDLMIRSLIGQPFSPGQFNKVANLIVSRSLHE